jgi:hypothetical protein
MRFSQMKPLADCGELSNASFPGFEPRGEIEAGRLLHKRGNLR